MPVVGRIVGDDRHAQLGHLPDLPHAALHASGNGRGVARRVMAGPAPERAVALLQEPDLGRREPEVAGERGGHDVEQLRLEELLVHLVDRSVEELQAAGTLLRLLEQADIAQRDRQLLGKDLQRLLFPACEAPLALTRLQMQHARDLAFEQHRGTEDP